MSDNSDKINQLVDKLDLLLKRQETFSKEVNELKQEIVLLTSSEPTHIETIEEEITEKPTNKLSEDLLNIETPKEQYVGTEIEKIVAKRKEKKPSKIKSDLEKFIGENLINKIGIAITIIGVAIGAKYAIDNQLISPLTRIILGYLVGLGLLGFAIKLKEKYDNFSAVLLSGAMTIMYFITYAAYSFYDLFPQLFAFLLMLVFTAFTVVAAIRYNKQVIAHIGLVGAYAVPFLLSEGSGKVAVLFSYITIINVGILFIAFKKYWKPLYYSSFILTWLIFFSWFAAEYNVDDHFGLALIFACLFFVIFYATFLAYKLLRHEKFEKIDILLLLINSFVFYGIGYAILETSTTGEQLLGVFTLCNGILHFIISAIIYKQKLADRNLFYLVSGLVLVFITIAILVQLDGSWVTLLWAGEAALLFWIGRTRNIPVYEKISYVLMLLTFFSLTEDWSRYNSYYADYTEISVIPILNVNFFTSIFVVAAFGFINILSKNKNYTSALVNNGKLMKVFSFIIPSILIITLFNAFRLEIAIYWDQLYTDSLIKIPEEEGQYSSYQNNNDLINFKNIWVLNYSLFFLAILSFVNIKKVKNELLAYINLGFTVLMIWVFLSQGLYAFSSLRESFLNGSEYYNSSIFHLGIRYVSFAILSALLVVTYQYVRQEFIKRDFKIAFEILLHATILWVASNELINWMELAESTQSYKLGLSILWGIYSLILIVLGIWKKRKHLRIGAFTLFTITLIKLFFYDIVDLDTISKTIVFISLGILLLVISFLYNKYTNIISDDKEN